MKAIKKAILLAVCLMMGAISQLLAQPMDRAGLNEPEVQYLITEYGDELGLTETQKNDLIALQIEQRNRFRPDDRRVRERDRRNFRRDRNDSRLERPERQEFRNEDTQFMKARVKSRRETRQEVFDILTDEQIQLLQTEMIEKAEKAHEFRTFRHRYIIEQADIEDNKANQVLDLLNAQSESQLDLSRQRISNPEEELNREWDVDQLQQMRDTDDELRSILTVNEYESLRKNLGFANSLHRKGRGARRRSR